MRLTHNEQDDKLVGWSLVRWGGFCEGNTGNRTTERWYFVYIPQLRSSEPSTQSDLKSHILLASTHAPLDWQTNWPTGQLDSQHVITVKTKSTLIAYLCLTCLKLYGDLGEGGDGQTLPFGKEKTKCPAVHAPGVLQCVNIIWRRKSSWKAVVYSFSIYIG